MLIELLNELIVDKIHERMGIPSLNAFLEIIDGRLGIIENFYPLDWGYVTSNPTVQIQGKEIFGRLLVAELLVRQTDRSPSKPEHLGIKEFDGRISWVPIDNGHSLKGCSRDYNGIDEDLNEEFISTLLTATQVEKFEDIEAGLKKVKNLEFNEIVGEAVRELLEKCNWTIDTREYFESYGDELVQFLNTRRAKLEDILKSWWAKKNPIEQPVIDAAPAIA